MAGEMVFDITSQTCFLLGFNEMLESTDGSKKFQKLSLSLVYSTFWMLWKEMNAIIFRNKRRAIMFLADDITTFTFKWITRRSKLKMVDWHICYVFPISNIF